MTIGASVCRGKARYACGDGLNPVELIKSLGKLGGIAWPTWPAENGAGPEGRCFLVCKFRIFIFCSIESLH